MTRPAARHHAAVAVLVVALTACGTATEDGREQAGPSATAPDVVETPTSPTEGGPSGTDATPGTGSEGVEDAGAATNAEALSFTGVDLDGEPVDAAVHAGGDVVLWMWAPW